ncbi:bifunctional nicotinamidase/pyrazinamidase [Neorhodopirellula pilleata]|uniref:Nicotinamidase n=1 Tax=Neorhodopirellula pilleata TaxID=2714738 RepID=A0A5C6A8V6_9BACT|nr:bifunctional nicotinamidase/pyrazinamidase [Neorhodopirellula pilleata]TWT95755.1 ADP-ribose pyrophosphatase [Neorhodopirellula pilleata]
MSSALILVDLQNDFLPGGALAVPHGNEVISIANQLQPFFHLVVATQDWHPSDHGSFASQHPGHRIGDIIKLGELPQVLWPDHCVQGSMGSELSPLLHTNSITQVFPKGTERQLDSYSGFFDNGGEHETGLGRYLISRKITDVYVLGLATDYCVRATALDSYRLGFRTWLIEDACRGVELQSGDCSAAIAEMKQAGVQCVTSDRWLAEQRDSVNFRERKKRSGGKFINIMQTGRWEYAERSNAKAVVVIVALTEEDEIVFIEQYREPIGKRCVELPAGLVGDGEEDEGEDLSEAVRRELREETGYAADRVTFLAASSSSAGLTNEVAHVYLAEGLRRVETGGGVDGELIQTHLVRRDQVDDWLAQRRDEGLDIAMSLYAALWLAQSLLAQR